MSWSINRYANSRPDLEHSIYFLDILETSCITLGRTIFSKYVRQKCTLSSLPVFSKQFLLFDLSCKISQVCFKGEVFILFKHIFMTFMIDAINYSYCYYGYLQV